MGVENKRFSRLVNQYIQTLSDVCHHHQATTIDHLNRLQLTINTLEEQVRFYEVLTSGISIETEHQVQHQADEPDSTKPVEQVEHKINPEVEKYSKMLRLGIPRQAVEKKMQLD